MQAKLKIMVSDVDILGQILTLMDPWFEIFPKALDLVEWPIFFWIV